MAIINKTLPSLYNGVSKQSSELRLDSQVEEMINCVPTLTNGIQRRQPLEFKSFGSTYGKDSFYHKYDRGDNEEKYLIEIYNNNIKVTDENGSPKVVNFEGDSKDYLNIIGDGYKSYAATTVGDTTFITNKEKVVKSELVLLDGTIGGILDPNTGDDTSNLQVYWEKELNFKVPIRFMESLGYLEAYTGIMQITHAPYEGPYSNNDILVHNILLSDVTDFKEYIDKYFLPGIYSFFFDLNINIDLISYSGEFVTVKLYGLEQNQNIIEPYFINIISILDETTYDILSDPNTLTGAAIYFQPFTTPSTIIYPFDSNYFPNYNNIYTPTAEVLEPIYDEIDTKAYYWIKRTYKNGIKSNIIDSEGTREDYGGYFYIFNGKNINDYDSLNAANRLKNVIQSDLHLAATTRESSIIMVYDVDNFKWSDSFGDLASFGWQDEVDSIQDLPYMKGYFKSDNIRVKITGENSEYYVLWNDKTWEETYKLNEINHLVASTMPHKLVREEDGTFTFSVMEWDIRKSGDLESNPMPSFVDGTINDIFFFKNRLGFLSGTSMVLSEVGSYYNFFLNSVVDILDSDFIDVGVAGSQVSRLEKAVTNNGSLLLFASNGQYVVNKSGTILSAEKITIDKISDYKYDITAGIVSSADSLFFIDNIGNYNNVYQYISNVKAQDITTHIPNYILGDIKHMEISEKYKTLILQTNDDNDTKLYIYNWHVSNNETVQSAWHKWDFSAELNFISNIYLFENILYISGESKSTVGQSNLYTLNLEVVEDISSILYIDGSNQFESLVELSKFKVSTGSSNVKDNVGKIQIRNVEFIVSDKSKFNIDIEKNIGGIKSFINSKSKLPILSNNNNVNIKFKNNLSNGFELSSVTYECLYKTISKGGI